MTLRGDLAEDTSSAREREWDGEQDRNERRLARLEIPRNGPLANSYASTLDRCLKYAKNYLASR